MRIIKNRIKDIEAESLTAQITSLQQLTTRESFGAALARIDLNVKSRIGDLGVGQLDLSRFCFDVNIIEQKGERMCE